jgi:hypothetical protein
LRRLHGDGHGGETLLPGGFTLLQARVVGSRTRHNTVCNVRSCSGVDSSWYVQVVRTRCCSILSSSVREARNRQSSGMWRGPDVRAGHPPFTPMPAARGTQPEF